MPGKQKNRSGAEVSKVSSQPVVPKPVPKLQVIPVHEWPKLRDLYRVNWPKHILSFNTIQNYINWYHRDPGIGVRICTTDSAWPEHGTYILEDRNRFRYNVLLSTLLPDNPNFMQKALKCMEREPAYTLTAYTESVRPAVRAYLLELGVEIYGPGFCPTSVYYLSYEKCQRLPEVSIKGFDFRPLKEDHIEKINNLWPHKYSGSEIKIKRMIQFNLTQGAFHCKTGDLCGWVMVTQVGTIGLLQVEETYKRLGIGRQLVIRLCKLMAAERMDATATVSDENVQSRNLFEQLGFTIIDRAYWFDKPALAVTSNPSTSTNLTVPPSKTSTKLP